MIPTLPRFRGRFVAVATGALGLLAPSALAQNTAQLGEAGWYSDDTRADGEGSSSAGTNLVSTGLTDAPEGPMGSTAGDADIRRQVSFGPAPGTPPSGVHRGAVHLQIGASGSGKSQISHRKDDAAGHAAGADVLNPALAVDYAWYGDGTSTVTASFKLGFKTADFATTSVSSRTGENAWDKLLIYEPGNLNGGLSNGTWHQESVSYTSGLWWIVDRTEGAITIGSPMTLASMDGSAAPVGGGGKTVGDVFALLTAPGARLTSVQFGIGSGNAGGSVYVSELSTNFYRPGAQTTFGAPLLAYDQDATNEIIFGAGNLNGEFTVDRASGVELALRGKLRFDASNLPANVFNSNGDGTYTFATGAPTGGAGWVTANTPRWNFEWSVNTDFDGSSGTNLDGLTYALGVDIDPGAGTNYIAFDPIAPSSSPAGYWDHAIGDNGTANGGGATAGDPSSYLGLLAANNLAQNSWNVEFFNDPPYDTFDPNAQGRYTVFLAAYNVLGDEVARTEIEILTERSLEYDQDVTNEVIFGSGNANGGFTTDRASGLELALRNKVRFPTPMNVFNSNGDGTYTYNTGTTLTPRPFWAFEWSVNTDTAGALGRSASALTYELGLDFDPSAATNYLRFDPIAAGSTLPYTPPAVMAFWDHAIGDNGTANGGGTSATDAMQYLSLLSSNNLVQNSWRYDFFDEAPFNTFDPDEVGQYEIYLAAFDGGEEIGRTAITTFVLDGTSLTLEADPCQGDRHPGTPGTQVEVELRMRNLAQLATGYQAFLSFDAGAMAFEPGLSSYSAAPFSLNITPMAAAEVAAGSLQLDGSVAPLSPGTDGDALLATLVFTMTDCTVGAVTFDTGQPFASELSDMGSPIATSLVDGPDVLADAAPPILGPSPDIVVPADAGVGGGCASAVVNYTPPTVVDTCSAVELVCTPPPGTAFPAGQVTQVTCVATDACGNQTVQTFDVEVLEVNEFTVEVELVGVFAPVARCIHFQNDDCATADAVLFFDDHDANPATAVRAMATVPIPCGPTSAVCLKDQQHTLWSTTTVSISGTGLVADSLVQLDGGDTDNDGDVDINDVTLFLAQFGTVVAPGTCAWDGTRNADFDNDGAVGSSDYTFLTANWLSTSGCSCTSPGHGGGYAGRPFVALPDMSELSPQELRAARAADVNGDGRFDVRDVVLFERRHGLSGELSRAMLRAGQAGAGAQVLSR